MTEIIFLSHYFPGGTDREFFLMQPLFQSETRDLLEITSTRDLPITFWNATWEKFCPFSFMVFDIFV